jgi:beta-N-acetylhexosaminidase
MTLEQKVGQMLMVGFKGPDHKGAIGFVRNYHVGGLVISRSNAITKTQLAVLTESLQQISRSDSGIDLLLATDQEGGSVAHIGKSICPPFASNATSGEENDEIGVIKQAGTTARVFHEVGLNMNFAPVLDVKTNTRNRVIGSRSYGSDPEKVAQLGCAYITELQRCGIIATAKHFPGHGPTSVDSHKDTPIASLTQEQMNIHVHPFKRAIRAGVDAIMTAHIIYTGYDNRPATLSNFWLNGYLRRDLGYQGVIITDSLGMGAIRKNYSWHNVVKDALDAGIDIFLICEGDDLKSLTRQYLLSSVRSGEVPESRIDESVVRILQLKQKYGLIKGGAAAQ